MAHELAETIVIKRWVIPRNELLLPNFRFNEENLFESAVFGTVDNSYRFKVVFNVRTMKFRLVLLHCAQAALYGFRLELIGLYNQSLRRIMPDFRTPDNVWLLWQTKNCDPACPELVIVCNVEIKVTTLFQYIHSTLRQSRDPSRQSINGDQLQRRRVSAKDGAIILYLKWSIAAELLVTPSGELNDQLFIESPTFGTVDQEYELKILLNTHTMCYNLLITKSPSASYYDVQLRMSGIFKQTIASTKDHELDGVVWIEWKPDNIRFDADQMKIRCFVRITPANTYILKKMAEHRCSSPSHHGGSEPHRSSKPRH